MAFQPTQEQTACVDAFTAHDGDLAITAGAGAGKTSTLKLLSAVHPNARGVYLAYNRAIATEAQADFPGRVKAKTSHALAFAAVGRPFASRLSAPRLPGREQAKLLGLNGPHRVSDDKVLAPTQVARIVMQTITKFCYSADAQPNQYHVPRDIPGIAGLPEAQRRLEQIVVPVAVKAWNNDLSRPEGKLRFSHDCYLKIWQLSDPVIDAEYLMLDEAQDTNPCVGAIFDAQTHLLRIAVGDPNQAIYGWRGAVDHMSRMDARYRLTLSKSFRFGQEIADEANKWLTVLDSDLRISGHGHSQVRTVTDNPDAVLCRTNAEAVATLIGLCGAGVSAGLVGGGKDLLSFADAAADLQESGKGWTSHPELSAFTSWGQVVDYVENDHGGEDFTVAVKLIESYGADGVRKAINNAAPENRADVLISTAHKSKGREWDTVRIADDFPPPKPAEDGEGPDSIARADAMLAYVSVTRAKKVLDRGSLDFVDDFLAGVKVPRKKTASGRPALLEVADLVKANPHANFIYRVKNRDGIEVARTTDPVEAFAARDANPGAQVNSTALHPEQMQASA